MLPPKRKLSWIVFNGVGWVGACSLFALNRVRTSAQKSGCPVVLFVLSIRVINAFRMTLDRYDNRSMSSLQSYHSVQNMRPVHGKRPHMYQSASTEAGDGTPLTGLSVSYTAPGRVAGLTETTSM
ncbi:hypothetical protein ElyMa_003478100 [Elysia marginata]|uniref:Secreted protein n=1 Tax=Elysia marginata TaxID=1093978 RepID=A0AAV4EBE3_9GAST|nr:hypothetical protein ElyMa_003478100 [Elysia marginata]